MSTGVRGIYIKRCIVSNPSYSTADMVVKRIAVKVKRYFFVNVIGRTEEYVLRCKISVIVKN